jgi:HD-GYP domain-containing protein (c-di-GMP phosphodiesterase class II)
MTITTERPTVLAGGGRWRRRPFACGLLRFLIVLGPLSAACVMGVVSGMAVSGNQVGAEILRLLVALVVSLVTFVLIEHLARRLLPLATLLKLSLVFPDHAPSRFSVALRSTSVRKLQEWARSAQHDDGPAALAEKVVTLAAALNTHDRRTRGHSERSRATAEMIAIEMGLTDAEVNEVRWGAFLHDIGKILVPATLLNKPGKPTPREWETLKQHPGDGGDLVEPLRGFLGSGVEAVREHHENYDGTGYPKGLSGGDIALAARIVSVADSFEVMTAVRSYKKPMKATEARAEVARHSGTQFDPAVVRALFNISLGRLHWSLGFAAWAAEVPFLTVIPRAAAQVGAFAAGPTISMSALSGVAAISLGGVVVPAALSSVPVNSIPPSNSSVVLARGQTPPAPSGTSTQSNEVPATGQVSASGNGIAGSGTASISGSGSTGSSSLAASANSTAATPAPTSSIVPTSTLAPANRAQSIPAVPSPPPVSATKLPPTTPPAVTAIASVVPDSTGNPHAPGTTGNPHPAGTTGNPHQ